MNRNQLADMIQNHFRWTQKIKISDDTETPGYDYSQIINNVYPIEMNDLEILVIGSAEGLFCIEAKNRGAKRVVGIDVDEEMISISTELTKSFGYDVEYYIDSNLKKIFKLGNFDYIICLNIIHYYPDPVFLINNLIKNTKKRLIIEADNLSKQISDMGKKSKSSVNLGFWKYIFKFIPAIIEPPVLAVDSRGGILISQNWIKYLVKKQHINVESISFLDSVKNHSYIADIKLKLSTT